jgi:uracil-DNA glycosylase
MKIAKHPGAGDFLPARRTVPAMRRAVQDCRGCDLYRAASQAVFGEGPTPARLLLVGEQPGNEEDIQGHPFVGPAGRMLDRALAEAGIDRNEVFVTNVVKHFKFEERGKRRIHKKPSQPEVEACRAWLEAEIGLTKPKVLVCLGATAAQALLGRAFRLTREHGRPIPHSLAPYAVATVHPSAILRAPADHARHQLYAEFVSDLKAIRKLLDTP